MPPPLIIRSGQGDYRVDFVARLDDLLPRLLDIPRPLVLADRTIARVYGQALAPLFERYPVLLLDATEDEKTLAGITKVVNWLQQGNATRQSVLLTVGGGIIQDIATFASHAYYRGISWMFVPTTLLSQCDSCIGAKCGINLNAFKNQLGVFHAPAQVVICAQFLDTLADQDVASGYGEILKLLYTGSRADFDTLKHAVERGGLRNPDLLALIRASLEFKKRVIEEDEYEKDLRRILNYGHTFGHALEALTAHEVPHGLAVAWGIDLVNYLATRRGLLAETDYQEVHAFIQRHLPWRLKQSVAAAALIQGSRRDKKVADGQVSLILAERPGSLKIVKTPFDRRLEEEVADYLAHHNVFAGH